MKRTTTLRIFSVLTAASASLFFVSCGEKKDGDGDSSAQTEKKDTPDSLTDELATQMNALADAMAGAKDKASAEEAVTKIDGIGDEIAAIAGRLDKLETPSEEKQKELDAKMEKVMESLEEKMKGVMTTVMGNPEVAQILGPAMQKFGKRMDEHDAIFERFGKKK